MAEAKRPVFERNGCYVDPESQYYEPMRIPGHLNPFFVRKKELENAWLSYTQLGNMTESQKDNYPAGGESKL
jgi:hypothetical protein